VVDGQHWLPEGSSVPQPRSADHLALGRVLRAQRHKQEWTLEQLGDLVQGEMNPRYISACERGEINISFANLLRLIRALELTLPDLADGFQRELVSARRALRSQKP
jgi:transcriptional regulator with XRE-family HTH domain